MLTLDSRDQGGSRRDGAPDLSGMGREAMGYWRYLTACRLRASRPRLSFYSQFDRHEALGMCGWGELQVILLVLLHSMTSTMSQRASPPCSLLGRGHPRRPYCSLIPCWHSVQFLLIFLLSNLLPRGKRRLLHAINYSQHPGPLPSLENLLSFLDISRLDIPGFQLSTWPQMIHASLRFVMVWNLGSTLFSF